MERLREFYGWLEASQAYLKSERGQTLIEYLLIIAVIALAIVVAYETSKMTSTISESLTNVNAKINAP